MKFTVALSKCSFMCNHHRVMSFTVVSSIRIHFYMVTKALLITMFQSSVLGLCFLLLDLLMDRSAYLSQHLIRRKSTDSRDHISDVISFFSRRVAVPSKNVFKHKELLTAMIHCSVDREPCYPLSLTQNKHFGFCAVISTVW